MKLGRQNKKGFTLVELGIAMGISIIVALAAVPYFSSRLPRYEVENTANEVAGYLRMLRNEAISRNETLSYSYVPGQKQIKINRSDNTLLKTIEVHDYSHGRIRFGSNSAFFNSQGQLLASAVSMNYTTLIVTVSDTRSADAREIRITSNGRITIEDV